MLEFHPGLDAMECIIDVIDHCHPLISGSPLVPRFNPTAILLLMT
jgi:hypothetical protein